MKSSILFLFLLSAICSNLTAQKLIHYTALSTSTELSIKKIYSIAIDAKGNKWFGGENGISILNGSTWTSYGITHRFYTAMAPSVKAIVADPAGGIWAASNYSDGISKFDGTKWTNANYFNNGPYSSSYLYVNAIAIDAAGNKWFGGAGVSKFDGTTWTNYTTANGQVIQTINAIAIDAADNKWFGTFGGVSKFDGTTWTNYTTTDGLGNNTVNAIAIDAMGNKWFGTPSGVSKFDGTTWTTYTTADGLVNNSVNAIAIDAAGNKWFGTPSGVSKFDGTTWTTYTTADGLVNNSVNAIAIDSDGSKWFGTLGGASKFDGATWTNFIPTGLVSGLAGDDVESVAVDYDGSKWFGTNGGVSKFNDTTWTKYTTTNGLVNNSVKAITIDAIDNKWIGTNGGVSKFDGTTWTNYTTVNGLVNNTVNAIAIDSAGNKWFGTAGGVSKFDGTVWTTYTTTDGLASNNVLAAAIDSKGNKWFGTDSGLSKFDGTAWTTYTMINDLDLRYVKAIAIDSQGNPWFASGNGGYFGKFDGTVWTTYAGGSGYGNSAIAIDASNSKWIGGGATLVEYDSTFRRSYFVDGGAEGGFPHSIAFDKSGNIWYGASTYGVYELVVCPQVPDAPVVTLNNNILQSSVSTGNQWYFNNTKIYGQNRDTYAPLKNGNYYSIVASDGCTSIKSNTVAISITNVDDAIFADDRISISPNPTTGIVKVVLSKSLDGDADVNVYNSVGILIESNEKRKSDINFEIDLTKQPSGLYVIRVHSGSTAIPFKVIKN